MSSSLLDWLGDALLKASGVAVTSLFVSAVEKIQGHTTGAPIMITASSRPWVGASDQFIKQADYNMMRTHLTEEWNRWQQLHSAPEQLNQPNNSYSSTSSFGRSSSFSGHSSYREGNYGYQDDSFMNNY